MDHKANLRRPVAPVSSPSGLATQGRAVGGPRVAQLTALSSTLNAAVRRDSAVAQLLSKQGSHQHVDVGTLTDSMLYKLAHCPTHDFGQSAYGYVFDHGDFELIKAEIRRRFPLPAMTLEDHMSDAGESVGVAASSSGHAMSEDEEYEPAPHEAMIAHLTTDARYNAGLDKIRPDSSGQERELKEWGERSLVGTMGEYAASAAMSSAGRQVLDLNHVRLNFSGLDHLSDDPTHPFEQTKLHISDSTANVDTYKAHAARAGLYAIKAVRALRQHQAGIRQMIADGFPASKPVRDLMASLAQLEGKSDDDIDGSIAHGIVSAGMAFSVPADIFDQIPVASRKPFRRMDMTVAQFQAVMKQMEDDYTKAKPSGSKPNPDDEEYIG